MADKQSKSRELSIDVKVDIDVADALTGLKAVTREAKEATKALKEMESTAQRLMAHMDADAAEYYAEIQRKDKPILDELLAKITEDNRHEVVDFIQRSYD